MKFKTFIADLLSPRFEEFITLYVPGPRRRREYANQWELLRAVIHDVCDESGKRARHERKTEAQALQEQWLAEVRRQSADDFRYLMLIEDRVNERDFMFHLLLSGCDWGQWDFSDTWVPRWKEMCGGGAFRRELDERTGGLIRHFVFKSGCTLETNNGERYRAEDFEEWKSY